MKRLFVTVPVLLILLVLCAFAAADGQTGKAAYEIGACVTFGAYEQDGDPENGAEPIEWIVIGERYGGLVLMSKYALDAAPYNTFRTDVTWETCTLRARLNDDFYNAAFSPTEQARIVPVTLENEDNPVHAVDGGRATQDRVWLLAIKEVTDQFGAGSAYGYFTDDASRMCAPTEYALARHAYQSAAYSVNGVAACFCWLRSPGDSAEDAACIDTDGSVYTYGDFVSSDIIGVRPVVVVLP